MRICWKINFSVITLNKFSPATLVLVIILSNSSNNNYTLLSGSTLLKNDEAQHLKKSYFKLNLIPPPRQTYGKRFNYATKQAADLALYLAPKCHFARNLHQAQAHQENETMQ